MSNNGRSHRGGSPKKILVIEDDPFYASICKTKLEQAGYHLLVTGDGEEGLRLAQAHKPSLILLDLILPVMDGFEVLKELRSDPKLHKTKVIIMSNLGEDEDIDRAQKMKVDDYFVKSNISIHDMIDKVKQHLH